MNLSSEKDLGMPSPSDNPDAGKTSDGSGEDVKAYQYPHVFKQILLAGASIVAVFLIALDQVSAHFAPSSP